MATTLEAIQSAIGDSYRLLRPIGRMGGMEYTRTGDHFTMLRKPYKP